MKRQLAFSLFLVLVFSLQENFAAAYSTDISGEWDINIVAPDATHKAQLTLKKDADNFSGTIVGPHGSYPAQAVERNDQVSIVFTIKHEGADIRVTLTGARKGDQIEGTADFGGHGQGTWTAARHGSEATSSELPAQEKVDVSGKWSFQVETPAGSGSPSFTFKQEGDRLTGQYTGFFGEAPVSGTVRNRDINFSFKVNYQNSEGTIVYKGTIEKDGTMKGTVALGDVGSGTWTAKRK